MQEEPIRERILSMLQFEAVYGVGRNSVRKMLKDGRLHGIRTPAGWRIADPGPTLFERVRRMSNELREICILRGVEVAELLGVSTRRVRQMAEKGVLRYETRGKKRLFRLASVLEIIKEREKGKKRGTGSYIRPAIITWAILEIARAANARQP